MNEGQRFEAEGCPLATGAPTVRRTTRRRAHPARRARRWVASSSVALAGGVVAALYLDAERSTAGDTTVADTAVTTEFATKLAAPVFEPPAPTATLPPDYGQAAATGSAAATEPDGATDAS